MAAFSPLGSMTMQEDFMRLSRVGTMIRVTVALPQKGTPPTRSGALPQDIAAGGIRGKPLLGGAHCPLVISPTVLTRADEVIE
jgi:hypothetical protein